MADRAQPEWKCKECGHTDADARAGARCPNDESVLVPDAQLQKYPNDRVLGTVIGGKYAAVGVLGSGGFGTVYRAVQEPVGRHVAVKLVHGQHAKDPNLRARFFREARIVARLTDPSVVTLFDYGDEPEAGLYTVFELVEGETLRRVLKRGPQDPLWVSHVLVHLLRALAEAHSLGMVHRDIKPANVMVVKRSDGDERIRLLDFGIAKVLPDENREVSVKTELGVVIGTPEYLSPEQARAKEEVDARSDLYSLGVLGYSLLAGENPFVRSSVIDTILAHCSQPPPPLSPELAVPPALEGALNRAMAKDPGDRFQTAQEMGAAICAVYPQLSVPSGMTPAPFGTASGFSAAAPSSGSGMVGGASSEVAMSGSASASGTASAPESRVVRVAGVPLWFALPIVAILLISAGILWAFAPGSSEVVSRPIVVPPEPPPASRLPPPEPEPEPEPEPAQAAPAPKVAEPEPVEEPEPKAEGGLAPAKRRREAVARPRRKAAPARRMAPTPKPAKEGETPPPESPPPPKSDRLSVPEF